MSALGPYSQEAQLMLFRGRVRARMEELGIGIGELADEVGQTKQCVSAWMVGIRLPSAVSLVRLARTLDVPIDWLLGESASTCGRRAIRVASISAGPRGTGDG